MTVRVTSPRETVAVVYRTTPPLPDSHQPSATAATTESDNKAPTIQMRRECGTDGTGGSADGFGTSTTGAGMSVWAVLPARGLFICLLHSDKSRSASLMRVKTSGAELSRCCGGKPSRTPALMGAVSVNAAAALQSI